MHVIQTLQYGLVEQQCLLIEQECAKNKQTQEEQQHALAQKNRLWQNMLNSSDQTKE